MAGTNTFQGSQTQLNCNGSAFIAKTGTGRICKLFVNTAGAGASLNDCATTGAAAASNLIVNIPNAVGSYDVQMPFFQGLCVTPGSAVFSLSFE